MTTKYKVATTGVAAATKTKAAHKKEAHLMTPLKLQCRDRDSRKGIFNF